MKIEAMTDEQIFNWLVPDECWHKDFKESNVVAEKVYDILNDRYHNRMMIECQSCGQQFYDIRYTHNPDFSTPSGMVWLMKKLGAYKITFKWLGTTMCTITRVSTRKSAFGMGKSPQLALRSALINFKEER